MVVFPRVGKSRGKISKAWKKRRVIFRALENVSGCFRGGGVRLFRPGQMGGGVQRLHFGIGERAVENRQSTEAALGGFREFLAHGVARANRERRRRNLGRRCLAAVA